MPTKRFAGLSAAQLRVFEQIATGNDASHPQVTLKALVRKGMIQMEWVKKGNANIRRYFVQEPIFRQWCEWCAMQPDGDTPPSTDTQQQGEAGEL